MTAVNEPQSGSAAEKDPLETALEVLVQAVAQLRVESGGQSPTASEVHLRIRSLTYGGFKAKNLGFKRFRDFLEHAKSESLIIIDYARVGDVSVSLPEDYSPPQADSDLGIRSDLWRAVVDWSPGLLRLYDRTAGKVAVIPDSPAPLEPERISSVRKRHADAPQDFVVILPVEIGQQIRWMRDFAESLVDVPQLHKLLLAALDGDKPAKYFIFVLKDAPDYMEKWYGLLRQNVALHLKEWVKASDLKDEIDIYQRPRTSPLPASKNLPRRNNNSRDKSAVPDSIQTLLRIASTVTSDETGHLRPREDLRQKLHQAIDRMPIDELRRISIPVGYLFED
ncbi:hypothetical protein GCM10022223_24090 [Kineosporia mesophila]|uniref:HTH OST-type domain-containing protein n=1 Tax=Kineosporia mesophila TaxID=566012 RepID=A0ABP6ZII0_9ACTN|nr:UPF0158 family protein [Kineosporia mesophila]MCD5354242.1 hypothetical protein [Kineosporia mesophila]